MEPIDIDPGMLVRFTMPLRNGDSVTTVFIVTNVMEFQDGNLRIDGQRVDPEDQVLEEGN